MKLIILSTKHDLDKVTGGSAIRIKGYTKYLKQFGVEYLFVAPNRPYYVEEENYIKLNFENKIQRYIKLYIFFGGSHY